MTDRASTIWDLIIKAVKVVSEKNCEKQINQFLAIANQSECFLPWLNKQNPFYFLIR
jgi:hypothetical protein